ILHEMGHVLDLNGYVWETAGFLTYNEPGDCLASNVVEFTGPKAVAEWAALGGSGNVPVENNGIAGTACSHWDEETFGHELMTGYVSLGMALSRLTVAALDDLAYQVNYAAADAYPPPPAAPLLTASVTLLREEILRPLGSIGPDGTMTSFPPMAPYPLDLRFR